MRPRRFSARSTPRQGARRTVWAGYQSSGAWRRRRARWIADGRANTTCPGCDIAVDPHRADVHHLAYPLVPGTEADTDLLLVCRPCHDAIHASLDASRTWRSMTRREATWAILLALHARHRAIHAPPEPGHASTGPAADARPPAAGTHDHLPTTERTTR